MATSSDTDIIDLDTLQSDFVTLDELFAPLEGEYEPYIDPGNAGFDDDAYWRAFRAYMVNFKLLHFFPSKQTLNNAFRAFSYHLDRCSQIISRKRK